MTSSYLFVNSTRASISRTRAGQPPLVFLIIAFFARHGERSSTIALNSYPRMTSRRLRVTVVPSAPSLCIFWYMRNSRIDQILMIMSLKVYSSVRNADRSALQKYLFRGRPRRTCCMQLDRLTLHLKRFQQIATMSNMNESSHQKPVPAMPVFPSCRREP